MRPIIRNLPIAILAIGLLFAVNASSALATSRTTLGSTELDNTTVRLWGTVSPEGHKTNYAFGWGTTENLEEWQNITPAKTTESLSTIEVSEPISGLTAGTKYYFAIGTLDFTTGKAEFGKVLSFTTLNIGPHAEQFMAAKYPVTIKGSLSQERVFKAGNPGLFEVNCKTRNLSGSLAAPATTLSLLPELSSCTVTTPAGPYSATVKVNSCRYSFGLSSGFGPHSGPVEVTCNKEGDAIEYVAAFGCTVKLSAQAGGTNSFVSNENAGPFSSRYLASNGWAWAMKWTSTGFMCGQIGLPSSGEDASLGVFLGTTLNGTDSFGLYDELYTAG